MTELDLSAALTVAVEAAQRAGALQLERRASRSSARAVALEFKGRRELVTEVDRASEAIVGEALRSAFPDHAFLAEEGWGASEGGGRYRWIIDPLDGTTNYAHGLPLFCVAIALEDRSASSPAEALRLGVVHAPALGETFTAIAGQGASLNGAPIAVSATGELVDAVLATGFAYDRARTPNTNIGNFGRLLMASRGVRRMGSAAIDLAYVACGRLDGYWEMHLQPYDVAAGALLVREAGGRVTDTEGGQAWLFGRRVIASNGPLHEAIQAQLDPVQEDGLIPL